MLRIWVVSRYGTEGGAVINLFHLLLRNGIKSEYVKGGGYWEVMNDLSFVCHFCTTCKWGQYLIDEDMGTCKGHFLWFLDYIR